MGYVYITGDVWNEMKERKNDKAAASISNGINRDCFSIVSDDSIFYYERGYPAHYAHEYLKKHLSETRGLQYLYDKVAEIERKEKQ